MTDQINIKTMPKSGSMKNEQCVICTISEASAITMVSGAYKLLCCMMPELMS